MNNNEPVVPNLVREGLKVLFVGFNPGLRTAEIGHHFAGHSNRFWRFLAASGLTPYQFAATEDVRLLELGYGITNIVARPSAAAAELSRDELREGAVVLRSLIGQYRPKVAAYFGKVIYQHLSGRKDIEWGLQDSSVVDRVIDFVVPNPSGLNRMPVEDQLRYYGELKGLVD
jgi:double-stranded uracil-DNA glycosylase